MTSSLFRFLTIIVSIGCAVATIAADRLEAQQPPASSMSGGTLAGQITEIDGGTPLAGVQVEVDPLGRGELSHQDGAFSIANLPPGTYRLLLRRIGYSTVEREVQIAAGETLRVEIQMRPSALEVAGVVVTAGGREQRIDEVFQPTTVVDGAELRRRMETSIAGTLEAEPGISQRYNGPAASQPVVRGLSGDRVLMLEDGDRIGDVSSTSADHASAIDPLGAESIEVVRGAASLLYGSSALGGVINVIRDDIPRILPEHFSGAASLQAESVNDGASAAAEVDGRLGTIAWRVGGSGRIAGETMTPLGVLPSTDLDGRSFSAGASWIRPDSRVGLSIRDFGLDYGVPGTFQGETIPGAHEDGVSIEMRRVTSKATAELARSLGPFSSVEMDGSYTWYHHREIESSGAVGTEFGQLSGTGRLIARHLHDGGAVRREGAVGLWGEGRDFSVSGSNTGTRPAQSYTFAGFGYEELGWKALRLQTGLRYDWSRIEPLDIRSGASGEVSTRDFGAFSASGSLLVDVSEPVTLGVTAARAFRTPTIEELFSDGPHLADYSFNIGNPSLKPEYGYGLDVFARLDLDRVRAEVAAFRNRIDGFIYYRATGELDPRLHRFPVYQASQSDALLLGGEAKVEWEAVPSLVLGGQVAYVRGTRRDEDVPLPSMPPMDGTLSIRYERPSWFATADWRLAGAQERVGENELPTPGYNLLELGGGLRWVGWGQSHSLTLVVDNVTNEVWRDHLSRIRAVAPQPGRNIRLLYRVQTLD